MGVYIPNMSKPKSCDVCRILRAEFDGSYDNPVTGCRQRMGTKNTLREEYDSLILDCPLIEIDESDEIAKYIYAVYGERRTETLDERIKRGLKEWREK